MPFPDFSKGGDILGSCTLGKTYGVLLGLDPDMAD